MKVVVACHGVRGEVKPCMVVGRGVRYRRSDADIAVPLIVVGYAQAVSLRKVARAREFATQMTRPCEAQQLPLMIPRKALSASAVFADR